MSDPIATSPYATPVDELRSKVRAILSQFKPSDIYDISKSAMPLLTEESRGRPVLLNPGDVTLKNRELILLLALYRALPSDMQSSFAPTLRALTTVANVRVVVPALVETENVGTLCTVLDTPPVETDDAYLLAALMWSATRIALSRRMSRFSNFDIARLERACETSKSIRSHHGSVNGRDFGAELDRVERMIHLAQYHRISEELLEANPEINSDQHVLVTRMEELGFRREIVESVNKLDRKVHEAGDTMDFAECMRLSRTIFEEILEDAGRKAAALRNHPLPPGGIKGNFSPWKDVLVKTTTLNGGEGILFQALYDYVSNTGTHRLASKREQARIARNMVIECGLLVVGRVQTLEKE